MELLRKIKYSDKFLHIAKICVLLCKANIKCKRSSVDFLGAGKDMPPVANWIPNVIKKAKKKNSSVFLTDT